VKLNSIEEIIADIRDGKMVVLMDDEDRENEGDLIMAASRVRAEDINFMAKHARGLICLTLTRDRCKQLNLPLMVEANGSSHGTNFTVSIEAAEGVTTGISAADRARTIQAAVAPNASPRDIVQPGHIFPLMAQPGGVLTRAGHTEAGCDLARLAGLEPSAVLIEIMNDDGTMARRPDLEAFAELHGLKIGTISDLIHHRVANEKTVTCVATRQINTDFGPFEIRTYLDSTRDEHHHALVRGEITPDQPTLVRVHVPNPARDLLTLKEPGKDDFPRWTFHSALERIAREDNGVMIIISSRMDSAGDTLEVQLQDIYGDFAKPFLSGAEHIQVQQVGIGSQILRDIGVTKMRLMGAPIRYAGLGGFDLEVVENIVE